MSTNMDSFSQESFLNGSQAQGFTVSSSLENPNPAMADANSMEFKPSNIEIKKTYHQFRNETEIKGESKGDYLKGRIALPPIEDPDFFFCIRLRLCPGEDSPENPLLLYPNLFFLQGKLIDPLGRSKQSINIRTWCPSHFSQSHKTKHSSSK